LTTSVAEEQPPIDSAPVARPAGQGQHRRATAIANVILAGALAALATALIYALFRSRHYSPGTLNGYVAALSAGLVLLALALKLPAGLKVNVALALMSVFGTVYLFEAFLACCAGAPQATDLRIKAARAAQVPYDTRTRYQVYFDEHEAGRMIVPSVGAGQLVSRPAPGAQEAGLLPLGGVANSLTLHCNESGAYTYYQADEFGFNNPPGLHVRSALVMVGDSFAHGNCVPPGDDVASQLRARQRTVLNLGYSGSGPLIELASLREYGLPLQPKTVLWLYYEGNDLADLLVEQKHDGLMKYLHSDDTQSLRGRQPEIDALLADYVQFRAVDLAGTQSGGWRNTAAARVARLQHLRDWLQLLARPPQPPTSSMDLLAQILTTANTMTTAEGGQLYFVYLPSWRRLAIPLSREEVQEREAVLAIAHDLGMPVIDLTETFRQHPDPLSLFPFRVEGHYTAEGYALVASAIDARLTELGASR
jgi:hypothetical protein